MNFDNLKSSYQSLSYSGEVSNIDFTKKIEGMVDQVRREDQKDKQRIIGVSILAGGFGIIYGLIGLLKYLENKEGNEYMGYFVYVLAIIAFVPILVQEYNRNKRINYDLPLLQFIEGVERRFALFQVKDILLIPGMLILAFSLTLMVSGSEVPTVKTMIISMIIIAFALTIGFLVRWVLWRKKLMLRDELLHIKESLQ